MKRITMARVDWNRNEHEKLMKKKNNENLGFLENNFINS